MHKYLSFVLLAGILLVHPTGLSAQTAQPDQPAPASWWSLAVTGGMTSMSPGHSGTLGGAMIVDLSDRIALEVSGNWLAGGHGSDGLTMGGGVILSLRSHLARTVPFVSAGAAAVRASFDMDDRAFLGRMSGQFGPGAWMVPFAGSPHGGMMQGAYNGPGYWHGQWSGPTVDLTKMPMFYQQRMGVMRMGQDGRWGMRSFTDPALSVGGGVRFNVSERLYIRPDARALVVVGDGDTHTIGTFTIGLGMTF
jgi:hypothetical protein